MNRGQISVLNQKTQFRAEGNAQSEVFDFFRSSPAASLRGIAGFQPQNSVLRAARPHFVKSGGTRRGVCGALFLQFPASSAAFFRRWNFIRKSMRDPQFFPLDLDSRRLDHPIASRHN